MTTFQCLGGEQGTGLSGFESAMFLAWRSFRRVASSVVCRILN